MTLAGGTLVMRLAAFAFAVVSPVQGGPDEALPYAAAYREAHEQKRPLLVIVGAEWCPACQRLKREAVPRLRDTGLLKKVVLAVVDYDRDQKIAEQLVRGGPIPQVFLFRPTGEGWRSQKMVGYPSREAVVAFVERGLTQQESQAARSGEDLEPTQAASKTVARP